MRCQPSVCVCVRVLLDRGKCQNSQIHFSREDDKGSVLGETKGTWLGTADPPQTASALPAVLLFTVWIRLLLLLKSKLSSRL